MMEKKRKYFTLVEATIVAVLFSLVGIALLAAFSSGIKIWNRVYKSGTKDDTYIFFDKISRDLHNTVKYNSIDFKGTKNSVSLATFVITKSKFSGLSKGIGKAIYYWDKENRAVFRTVQNLSDVYKENEGTKADILDNVNSFDLSYCFYDSKEKKFLWLDEWDKKSIPVSVKIMMSVSYNNDTTIYSRTVDIPQGVVAY